VSKPIAAIDMDGTFWRYPYLLARLTENFEPIILTGTSHEDAWTDYRSQIIAEREKQVKDILQGIGITIRLIVCCGTNSSECATQKAEWCKKLEAVVFIDDSDNYCDAVRRENPNILILKVWP